MSTSPLRALRAALVPSLAIALLASLLWPTSTAILDFLYERVTFGNDTEAFLGRLDVQWGAPYPLLLVVLFAAPLAAGKIAARRS